MNIIILETGKNEHLKIVSPGTGVDYTQDFVGNTGALQDGSFNWNNKRNAYVCSQEVFDWWKEVVTDNQVLENKIFRLEQHHGKSAVQQALRDVGNVDLEDYAAVVSEFLDQRYRGSEQ